MVGAVSWLGGGDRAAGRPPGCLKVGARAPRGLARGGVVRTAGGGGGGGGVIVAMRSPDNNILLFIPLTASSFR